MSLIEVKDVTFQYGTQPNDEYAVSDVDFSIEDGQFIGITGQSEAGKATLCRLISGQIPHFYHGDLTGTITVEDVSTADSTVGDLSKKIGFVFQNPYDQLTGATSTVLEEVAFGLESHGLTRDEIRNRARESLAAIGVEHLADRNPMQLSGGQCQRVAIASVIAMQPDVLVLRQPTAQLDPEGTEEVFDVVGSMNDNGYTIVMVSQEVERLVPHLDRLVVMDDGKIRFDGQPDKVLIRAIEEGLPVPVPDPVKISHRLRDVDIVPADEPISVTESGCLTELRRVVNHHGLDPESGQRGSVHEDHSVSSDDGDLVLDDLHHQYPSGVEALRGVSFSLNDGCVCLIGQNGAGKSTLVKHLNGLLEPTEGVAYVHGTKTTEHTTAELAHKVGLSFQNPDDQLFHSTVEEEIQYGPQNLGFDDEKITTTTDRAIELLGLADRRDESPYDFGEPWRKRVAVASIIAMDTPIVVLDEPTSGQDAPGYKQLGDTVDELVNQGKLVVIITHDMDFVREHADRTVLLANGKVIADGNTRAVLGDAETLAHSNVYPPTIMRLSLELGFGALLTVDELLDAIGVSTSGVSP